MVTRQKKEHTLQSVSSIIHPGGQRSEFYIPTTAGTIRRFLEHYGEDIDVVVFVADAGDVSFVFMYMSGAVFYSWGQGLYYA